MNVTEVGALLTKAHITGLKLPVAAPDEVIQAWAPYLAPYMFADAAAALDRVGRRTAFLTVHDLCREIEEPTVPAVTPRWMVDRAHYLAYPEPDAPTCDVCGMAYRHARWCESWVEGAEPVGLPAFCYPPDHGDRAALAGIGPGTHWSRPLTREHASRVS